MYRAKRDPGVCNLYHFIFLEQNGIRIIRRIRPNKMAEQEEMLRDGEPLIFMKCRVAKIKMSDFHFSIAHSISSAAVSRCEILEIDGPTWGWRERETEGRWEQAKTEIQL